MTFWKRIGQSVGIQSAMGLVGFAYLRLFIRTTRFIIEPADIYERWASDLPFIVAMWHGQHFLMPYLKRPELRVKALISRHRDGGTNAEVAQRFGLEIVRGSGTLGTDVHRNGGAVAFRRMVEALQEGHIMALTRAFQLVGRA